jgi:hypothetical protein
MDNTANLDHLEALSRYTVSFGISLAVTSVVNALLVVAKETHDTTVMAWMNDATGHNWATQSLLSLIPFFVLGLMLARCRGLKMAAASLVKIIVAGVAIGGLIILGFYFLEIKPLLKG